MASDNPLKTMITRKKDFILLVLEAFECAEDERWTKEKTKGSIDSSNRRSLFWMFAIGHYHYYIDLLLWH